MGHGAIVGLDVCLVPDNNRGYLELTWSEEEKEK
jgi:hypothetical protein